MKIFLSGEGGQGIQLMAKILTDAARLQGFEATYMPHYGVEMRMGISLAFVQFSKGKISYPKFEIADVASIMTSRSIDIVKQKIGKNTHVVNGANLQNLPKERNLPNYTFNMIILGAIVKEINKIDVKFSKDAVLETINKNLAHKPELTKNRVAFEVGYDLDEKLYLQSISSIRQTKLDAAIDKDKNKEHIKYPDICKSCGLCLEKCPVKALTWDAQKINFIGLPIPKIDLEKCTACGMCEQICPDAAIRVNKFK